MPRSPSNGETAEMFASTTIADASPSSWASVAMASREKNCVFHQAKDCLATPSKLFICSTCGFSTQMCASGFFEVVWAWKTNLRDVRTCMHHVILSYLGLPFVIRRQNTPKMHTHTQSHNVSRSLCHLTMPWVTSAPIAGVNI